MAVSSPPAPRKKLPWLKLGAVAFVLAVIGLLVLRGLDVRGLLARGIAAIQAAGPFAFFTAMAILPGIGAPVSAFNLAAGPSFSDRLGTPLTVVCALVAVTINLVVTYALARRALRPFLQKWITRAGYKMPEVEAGDAVSLVAILRLTPGIPFFIQNYLSGLAEVPFGKYIVVSLLIAWPSNAAMVIFGDALLHGRGKMAVLAISLLVVIAAVTHVVRRHLDRRRIAA